jgi:Tfp pilus assembly protein PilF
MTPELWERLKPLFHAAAEKPEGERHAFIAEVCGEDEELRAELEGLIKAHLAAAHEVDDLTLQFRNLAETTVLPKFAQGELLLERFRIERCIGSGGMGDVYEAMDLELSQTIALKTIRSGFVGNLGILARFKKEVQLARRIGGTNICRIHEFFVVPTAPPALPWAFLTMEYLDGVTLADRIEQGGPIPWREAQSILVDVCCGLTTMHAAGIVHRDLKSRNIMLVEQGARRRAVLMDFGLAREYSAPVATTETALTMPGAVVGTPEYMAPEQFEGKEVSPATDIDAAGVVLYEMVTGKHPFAASSPLGAAMLRAKLPQPASALQHGVPHRWDHVIRKCLEYEAAQRYQSAEELARAIREPFPTFAGLSSDLALLNRGRIVLQGVAVSIVLLITAALVWRHAHLYIPPAPEAQRAFETGIEQLREGAYFQATRALQKATSLDRNFGLAHARLAEAWAELDYTGNAEHEMVLASAPEEEKNLPDLDRRYIEAVRATLIHDLNGAVRAYRGILEALPEDQKGYGYVDLGMAQEKTGDIHLSLQSYEKAAQIRQDNPAAFVHLGILKSRLQDTAGAEAAFERAEDLFKDLGNSEGLAEVAYQRGHAANDRGEDALANKWLEKCRDLALHMPVPSAQLEVRALTQLSSLESYSDPPNKAVEYADQALKEAQDNNLEYWATDALVRKANGYISKLDLTNADTFAAKALQQAERNQHPRLIANAQLVLASVRDKQGKRDEQIELAQKTLQFDQTFGFATQARQAEVLIARGEDGKGDYASSLQAGRGLLELAEKSGVQTELEVAHETVGGTLLGVQQYPDALAHFREALRLAKLTHESESYQALHCADALWRLGQYVETDALLRSIPSGVRAQSDFAAGINRVDAEIFLSQRNYPAALRLATNSLKDYQELAPYDRFQFQRVEALAEAESGHNTESQKNAVELASIAASQTNADLVAQANLTQAIVFLRAQLPDRAEVSAQSAQQSFQQRGEMESQWMSLAYLAEAAKARGDQAAFSARAKQALDILDTLQHNWSPQTQQQYRTRPDVTFLLHMLNQVKSH